MRGDSAPQRNSAGAIDGPTETRLLELREGDCVANMRMGIEKPDGGHNGVPKIVAVPCSQPHDGEILLIEDIGDGDWPGAHIVDGEAARGRQGLTPRLARARGRRRQGPHALHLPPHAGALGVRGSARDRVRRPAAKATARRAAAGLGRAGLDESGFVGEHDGLDAVAEPQLAEDAVDVGLDGAPR